MRTTEELGVYFETSVAESEQKRCLIKKKVAIVLAAWYHERRN